MSEFSYLHKALDEIEAGEADPDTVREEFSHMEGIEHAVAAAIARRHNS